MKKIVIIGGGIAGLSAGCYALMNGYETHIFEMHNLPGGLCTAWKRNGYTFDFCIHWLEGTSPDSDFHKIWQELGAIQGKEVYYKEISIMSFIKNQTINFYNDPDKLANYLKEIAPEDSVVIDEFADTLRKWYEVFDIPLTKPKELFTIIDRVKMIISFLPIIKIARKTIKTTVDEFADKFKNPLLQEAIRSLMVDYDELNLFGMLFLLANKGVGVPQGSSLNFTKSIERRYISLGGKIHYGAKIKKILVSDNEAVGIQLEDGNEGKADIVISAADGYSTIFKMLDGKFINKKIKKTYESEPVFPSYLQVSIGVDMDLSGYINPNTNYNVYKFDKPIMIEGEERKYLKVKNYAYDPTFAPKGKTTLVTGFKSDLAYWEKLYQDKEKYKQEKQKIENIVISSLEKIVPGIKEKIETIDVATPMTIYRYTNNWKGSTMGWANPFSAKISRTLPKLKNFFMAGQWVGDTGVSGAAQSGRDCMEYICKIDKREFITTKP